MRSRSQLIAALILLCPFSGAWARSSPSPQLVQGDDAASLAMAMTHSQLTIVPMGMSSMMADAADLRCSEIQRHEWMCEAHDLNVPGHPMVSMSGTLAADYAAMLSKLGAKTHRDHVSGAHVIELSRLSCRSYAGGDFACMILR